MLFRLRHGENHNGKPVEELLFCCDKIGQSTSAQINVRESATIRHFAYLFGDAPDIPHHPGSVRHLDRVAKLMIEQESYLSSLDSGIAPIYTYLSQFISNDIVAGVGAITNTRTNCDDELTPIPRKDAARHLLNLRSGLPRLDSLYGDCACAGKLSGRLKKLIRSSTNSAKLRLGTAIIPRRQEVVPTPDNQANDLPRIKELISDNPQEGITESELKNLPSDLKSVFFDQYDKIIPQRALIGDSRNDNNLILAQLHLAFLRFHNHAADWLKSNRQDKKEKKLFSSTQALVRKHYQWLIVNDYLNTLCRQDILNYVLSSRAPLYQNFLEENPTKDSKDGNGLPIPLEFFAAAFRFNLSMVRGSYDYNRFFGATTQETKAALPAAPLELLFQYTGNSPIPMPDVNGASIERLPSNWIIEWQRFVNKPDGTTIRAARKIDTFISPDLGGIGGHSQYIFQCQARNNLRLGYKLNIPSSQACIKRINRLCDIQITPLSEKELTSGKSGSAIRDGGFIEQTPLWYYILKEAQVRENGERLGMLGSTIVCETLIGLMLNDPESYLNTPGSDHGHWGPVDGVRTKTGEVINSFSNFLRAASVLR